MSGKMERESTKSSVIINSLDRAIDIIEYIYRSGGDTSISHISRDLDIYKSTVFRTLATLENRGYVIQNKVTELYSIGPKLYAYSESPHENALAEAAKPYLEEISNRYQETVTFGVLGQNYMNEYLNVPLATIESKHGLGLSRKFTNQKECYCASLGKCLLAFSKDIDFDVYRDFPFIKFTDNTITNYDDFMSELDEVKKQGYGVDDEEREVGLYCIGVPVLNSFGYAEAAVSISGPKARVADNYEEKIAFLKEMSKKISEALFL